MDVVRVLVLALLAAGSLAQGPIIAPVIVSAPAGLNFGARLDQAASRPEYAFAYGVEDPKSGNAQSHKEERDGNQVRGEYKVLEADGSVRTVTYTVDPKNGFQANVHQSDPSFGASGGASPASAQTGRQADIPSDIRVDVPSSDTSDIRVDVPSDVQVDVPVDVSGSADHADYFSGPSIYASDFDP